ncbi:MULTISPECIES: RNA polymerase sigma factor FliA [Limnobacter]|jgi:RNA polymerase sigma factor FliA|uniref:RNA polymerase sigma factor FliA n=2 Tax=Pseudomonadota TaxID=1224 RepID=A0ABX6N4V1_9BURK|nr:MULTISPECIES: RNA polymerase sigma factor FliA [unclassified Limnobacter]MAG82135.1 RNA polymerase sigma factor FliA [Sutterellaceae bacterium]MBA4313739.1 RNA polymerase sigma factor FliA [Alcaligenaceae bacterium]PZO13733.1 MAG: RNA polymerase sigma factor FliA [Betaproteobacteria bacterium]MBT82969.1 RNA polymerase sigma factor FliA [Sutterellaceae bacterium]MDP3272707.1 RNA polymerase sigma factor FliA [Limnobacter sp.]|tara:strand:+ start:2271 stop:2987 length:717 start_codon:yes stop_codon:yes gene_type:complete
MYTAQGTLDKSKQVDQYIPLVRRLAHHLIAKLPASVQIDDLIQAGLIGLMDAITRFEEGQGAQFETYASQRIRGSMLDELRSADWMPRGVRQAQRKIETATLKAEQKLGRSASEKEIAEVLGVSLDEYQEMLFDSRGASLVFYDDYADDGDGEGYLDRQIGGDEEANPLEMLGDQRFRENLIQAIEDLPEREKMLMGLYYEQELNFREIAAVLGVTESRVCQLHTQAVSRLKAKLREH